jgi:hypothetical protein
MSIAFGISANRNFFGPSGALPPHAHIVTRVASTNPRRFMCGSHLPWPGLTTRLHQTVPLRRVST